MNTRMSGHLRKRGGAWEVVLELGLQPAQRCAACMAQKGRTGGRLLWIDADRLEACPVCGGDLEDVRSRRQIVVPDRYATKREAQDRLIRELQAGADGAFVEPSTLTVGDFLRKEWLPSLEAQDLAANTVSVYTTHVEHRIAPVIGHVPLQKLTSRHVNQLATHLATKEGVRDRILSPATRRQALFVLSRALKAAVHAGYIRVNPAQDVKRPKVRPREMQAWTAEELRTFLKSTRNGQLYPLWRFLSQTGLRRGEALGVRMEDIDLDAGTVTLRRQLSKSGGYAAKDGPLKAGRSRPIDLDQGTVEALRAQLQQQLADAARSGEAWEASGYVFTREDGLPWHPDVVSHRFDMAVAAASVPRIRLHDLRHTWATIALRAGIQVKVVQERLGHASIKTTMDTYTHVMPGMQRSAAELVAALVDGTAEDK